MAFFFFFFEFIIIKNFGILSYDRYHTAFTIIVQSQALFYVLVIMLLYFAGQKHSSNKTLVILLSMGFQKKWFY